MAFSRIVAVVLVDLVVDELEPARPEQGRAVAAEGLDLEPASLHLGRDPRQVVLRKREEDGDGIELGDHHDPAGVAGADQVAGVDEAHAGDAVDRRDDPGVVEVEARALDGRAIHGDGSLQLADRRRRVVEGRSGVELPVPEDLVPGLVQARVLELRRVAGQRPLRLVELDLERPGVDLGEELALLDGVPFLEVHVIEPAVDLRLDRDGLEGRGRSKPLEPGRDVAPGHGGRGHRDGPLGGGVTRRGCTGARTRGTGPNQPGRRGDDRDQGEAPENPPSRLHACSSNEFPDAVPPL